MEINEALDNLYVCATNAKSETLEEGYYEKCYDRVIEELEQIEYIENEYGRTIEQKDKIIDEMAIRIFNLQEWIKKQVDYECFSQYKTVEDIKRIFEERCKNAKD